MKIFSRNEILQFKFSYLPTHSSVIVQSYTVQSCNVQSAIVQSVNIQSFNVQSCYVHPCEVVRQCPVLQFQRSQFNVPSSLLHARTAEALHVLKDASRCRTVTAVPSLASFGELLTAGTWQDVHCRRRSTQQSCMLRRFFDIKVAKVHASSFPRLPTVAYRHTGGVRGVRTRCQENTFFGT